MVGPWTFITRLTADAPTALWVMEEAMDGVAFASYVAKVLVMELAMGGVVIFDKSANQKPSAARAMLHVVCWSNVFPT